MTHSQMTTQNIISGNMDQLKNKQREVMFDDYKYDAISIEIWNDNYRHANEETRKKTWERVAKSCALAEPENLRKKIEKDFLKILYNDRFVPGGRILANLGIDTRQGTTLYNCFVHNVNDIKMKDCDSIDGIYDMLKAQAKTLKSEGGYGINASWIRPAGSYVNGIGSRTPGSIKFMELWDKSSEIITQGSNKILGDLRKNEKVKIRKGAQMFVLEAWHPDIEDFIVAKQTEGRLTKFNMSVGVTEGFVEAIINDKDWKLKFPDTECQEYKNEWFGNIEEWEKKGLPVIVFKTVKARNLWDSIMEATYSRNEPGVLFLDVANKLNPAGYFERIATTNPCGEVPMSTGVCNLGSLNLVSFLETNNEKLVFNYNSFKESVSIAIRFLDNINDISTTPLPEYTKSVKEKRRIGLGVMGLGSLHLALGIKYGSEESVKLTREIFKVKAETEILTSAKLGKEKGSFTKFSKEKYFSSYWWKNLKISDEVKWEIESIGEMRNSHQSMNAPTGNTGIYARNVSGGIEPSFAGEYYRWAIVPESRQRILQEKGFKFPNIGNGQWFETEHLKFTIRGDEQVLAGTFDDKNYEVDKNRGLVIRELVQDYGFRFAKAFYGDKFQEMEKRGCFSTVNNLEVADHVAVLKEAAHFTNMSISKTLNLPADYPYEDFKDLYLNAWKNEIKGITTYREGTMTAVLETKSKKRNNAEFKEIHAPKRPEQLACDIYHMQVRGEKWNFFVGLYENKPYEIFAGRSKHIHLPRNRKSGYIKKNGVYNLYTGEGENELVIEDLATVFINSTESAFTRTVSLALRHGAPVQYIVEQIEKGAGKESEMFSLAKGLMRALKPYIKNGTKPSYKKCQRCSSDKLSYQEGCVLCLTCGYSRCG